MRFTQRLGSARAVLSERDFRRLCAAQAFGGLGEWLATLALIALVWDRTRSAVASGVILAFRILPAAVIGSLLGRLVDRLDRRRVLVAATAGRACVYGALPIVGGVAPVLALALVAEIASLTYICARDATVPRLVPKEALPLANAISMASAYGAMPIGSGLFALMAVLGERAGTSAVGPALIAAAGLLGVATLILGGVGPAVAGVGSRAREPGDRGSRGALVALVRSDPVLRRVALGGAVAATAGGVVLTLGIAYVGETLRAGPAAYSGLLSTFCLGAVVGIVGVQRARAHLPRVFRIGVGSMGAILVAMAMMPTAAAGYGFGFVFGGAFVATMLGGITILQERVHDELRGRAFALAHSGLRIGAVAVGIAGAWAAKAISVPVTLGVLRFDGNQVVFGTAGLVLALAAIVLIRTSPRALAAAR